MNLEFFDTNFLTPGVNFALFVSAFALALIGFIAGSLL